MTCSVGSTSQLLTSWAQRQKLRARRNKAGQASSQNSEYQEQPCSLKESHKQSPPQGSDSQDQVQPVEFQHFLIYYRYHFAGTLKKTTQQPIFVFAQHLEAVVVCPTFICLFCGQSIYLY